MASRSQRDGVACLTPMRFMSPADICALREGASWPGNLTLERKLLIIPVYLHRTMHLLERTSIQLSGAAALAEKGFLAMGQRLEEAVAILDRLAARFAGYLAELTGEALAMTRRDLSDAGAHVAALAAARSSDAVALNTLGEIIGTAARRVAALQPLAREVETLSLSTRVVAGSMGQTGADFLAFGDSIREAAQRTRACLDSADLALGQAAGDLTASRTEADAFARRHGDAMQAIPRRIADNLASLATQQRRAVDAAADAQAQSEAVRQRVGEQIVALQLGDSLRQRLEHVQAVLVFAGSDREHESPGAANNLPGDLLAAQLVAAADDLAGESQQIEAGLQQLAVASRAIGQLGVSLHGAVGGGEFVAALEADIRQTAALFGELSAGDATSELRMEALRGAAATLAARLKEVESVQEDLRITGLNATLRCGRLGLAGRPLAAVAQELRQCGSRCEAHAVAVRRDLDRLLSITDALCDPSRHDRHVAAAQATDLLLEPLQRLRRLDHDLAAILSQLQSDAVEVGRLVEVALAQFAMRHELAAALREAAAAFAALQPAAGCPGDVLDRIAAGYTMAREREVHARFAPLPLAEAEQDSVLF